MQRLELGYAPRDGQPSVVEFREDPSTLPSAIKAKSSAAIMTRFFLGIAQTLDGDVLLEVGGELMHSVRRGFMSNMSRWGKDAWQMEPKELEMLLRGEQQGPERIPDPEDTEAFARFQIATGLVPQLAADELIPGGFSKHGIMAAPTNVKALSSRINETGIRMHEIATGSRITPPSLDPWNEPANARAFWTVTAMGAIPLKTSGIKEAQEVALKTVREIAEANPKDPRRK